MIIGIGVDVVDVARFDHQLRDTPSLRSRLFVESERALPLASLAARFAAKEAVIKAFGGPVGSWHDVWVEPAESGRPELHFSGAIAAAAQQRGITDWHVSLSHDAGVATAFVVLEARP